MDVKHKPQVPYKMRNGSELLSICINFEQNYGVVMCRWERGDKVDYVTWQARVSDVEVAWDSVKQQFVQLLVTTSGHYFDNITEAGQDMIERILKGY